MSAPVRQKKKPPAIKIGILSALFTLLILGMLPGGYVQLYVDATMVVVLTAVIAAMLWLSFLFFRSRPLRLLELMIMVAAVGNALGLLSRKLLADEPDPSKFFAFILLALSSLLITCGGAAWGLWVAKALRKDGTAPRAGLVLLGIAAPASVIGLLVAGLHLMNNASLPEDERLLTHGVLWASALIAAGAMAVNAYARGRGAGRREGA